MLSVISIVLHGETLSRGDPLQNRGLLQLVDVWVQPCGNMADDFPQNETLNDRLRAFRGLLKHITSPGLKLCVRSLIPAGANA